MTQTQSQIAIAHGRRGSRIRLTGDIELAMAGELHRAASELAGTEGQIEVDCRHLGHLSGAALQVLAALAVHLDATDRKLRAIAVPARARPLLEMAGSTLGAQRTRKGRV